MTFLLPTAAAGIPSLYAMSVPSIRTSVPVGENYINFIATYSSKKLTLEVRYSEYVSTVTYITNVTLQYTVGI